MTLGDEPTAPAAPTPSARLRALVLGRMELVLLAVLLLGTQLLPGSLPTGIVMIGVVTGAAYALQAVGIVLIFRANRLINFAQVQLGVVAALFFTELVSRRIFLHGLRAVCPQCLPAPDSVAELRTLSAATGNTSLGQVAVSAPSDLAGLSEAELGELLPEGISVADTAVFSASGWTVHVMFWLSVVVSIAVAVAFSYAAYALIVRRFANAPRTIATVVTIGLAQVLVAVAETLTSYVFPRDTIGGQQVVRGLSGPVRFPFEWRFELEPAVFGTAQIITLLVAGGALVGLAGFFSRSSIGVALRGSADNPERAQSLGVNVASVNSVVWVIAGGLSAIAGVLGATEGSTAGSATLVRLLTVAVLATLVSIPVTVLAAIVLGVVDQAVTWSADAPGVVDGVLLLIVVCTLLVQRARSARADTESEGGWRAAREMRPIPAELRELPVVKHWVRRASMLGIGGVLVLPWLLAPGQTNLAAVTLLFGIIGLSLLILTGWAGQISLGQFAFAAVGAYVAAVLDWPFPLSVVVGALGGSVAAVLIGLPALRLRGLHLAITTLAFATAVSAILLNRRYLGGALPSSLERPAILGLDLDDQRTFYYVVLLFLGLAVTATIGMRRSRTARALIACRDNEAAAQAFGINLISARLAAFAISGFMAAFAGGLFAYSQYGVSAQSFGVDRSIEMFLMVVIGGLGSVAGPLIGAAFFGAADMFVANELLSLLGTGVGVVVLLLFVPGGLGELAYGLRDTMLRRVADRYRIEVPSLVADRQRGLGSKAPIAPPLRPGGGTAFVPARYRVDGQWAVDAHRKEAEHVGS